MNKHLRWWMLGFAFTATVINYLDRQALSVAAPVLRAEFHLRSLSYAHIVFAFLLAYTLMNGISGLLIDRLGTKIGYGLFVAWWSLSALLHSFAQGSTSLGMFRFLLGLGEAGNWPGAVKIVAEWFSPNERSTASGIFNSGSAVGAILAPPIIAFMLLHYGWRSAFAIVGAAGFVWLVAWIFLYRSPVSGKEIQATPLPYKSLLRSRFVWTFTISKIFFDPVWYFYTFWFPEYLSHGRHFDMASIGRYGWIPFFIAGLGSALGGLLSRGLLACGSTITVARKTAVSIAAIMMLAAIPSVLVQSAVTSIALISLAMAGYTAGLANMLAMPADVVPPDRVAFVYGFASMGSGFGGMIFTLLTGWLIDHYSYAPAFFLFGLIPIACSLILWLWMGSLESQSHSTAIGLTTTPSTETA
ncbi:MFS transporter [Edaphobacter flagellatus]|uniref:MFS transporter n=1 Tax=Edaphobacter flagellatus TaxID=1933044 RepID=UPI0021B3FF61|nr:MFS transporter [Edaphobacter flagellatus]